MIVFWNFVYKDVQTPTYLKWYYAPLRINGMCKVEIQNNGKYLTSVHRFILNIVAAKLWHKI